MNTSRLRLGFVGLVCITTGAAASASAPPASVAAFSPTGVVKQPRQVVARFSEPMVALGDPRAATSPFHIDCPAAGAQRWTDSRTWVFDFEEELAGGLRCTFTVVDGFTTLVGGAVAPATFRFSTGGPAVRWHHPSHGEIEENQAIVLGLDATATEASILEHVFFSADDVVEKIGVQIVADEPRAAILATLYPELREGPIVIVQPRQTLPPGRKVRLVWGAGVATLSGEMNATDHVIALETRPVFTATFSCSRAAANADCSPLRPLALNFSAPLPREIAAQTRLRAADGRTWEPRPDPSESATVEQIVFPPPFPESQSLEVIVPADVADDSGRPLSNAARFPLAVRTAPYPPLAKFAARFGIIEAYADPALPVTVRNIESEIAVLAKRATEQRDTSWTAQIWRSFEQLRGRTHHIPASEVERALPWLRRIALTPRDESVFADTELPEPPATEAFTLPKPLPTTETEVLGIPLTMPGLHIVEIESPSLGAALLGKTAPMYVPAAALVTNLGVHFKWGASNSLVWVTHLDDATPAANAEVFVLDCANETLWKGTTDAAGRAFVSDIPPAAELRRCPNENWPDEFWSDDFRALRGLDSGLLVVARTADDFSFVHSSWDDGIEPWRFRVPATAYGDPAPIVAHTILDRALFRPGETVHMKHVFRRRSPLGLDVPDADTSPQQGRVVHIATRQEFPLVVEADAAGVATGTWNIPRGAKLGRYAIDLGGDDQRLQSAEFRVEEFRIPAMTGTISFAAASPVAPTHIDADVSLRYLAGGAAGGAPIVIRSQTRPRDFTARHPWSELRFATGPVKTGVVRRAEYSADDESSTTASVDRIALDLDNAGSARVRLPDLPAIDHPSELVVEMEYRDPSGEVQTIAQTMPLLPAALLVAIDPDGWVATPEHLHSTVVVVDPNGSPVEGAEVEVQLFEQQTYSHRKRLVGGFYAYEHITETSGPIASLCRGRTASNGAFRCEATTDRSGNLVLAATVHDAEGRTSVAHAEVWAVGEEHWWFDVDDHDRIDLIPERSEYAPGETARIQVRSPFREATALVTVEREGILESFVTTISGTEPIVEVPIGRDHAPNVFVSVLAVRGRIGDVQPTALLDLGKPAYKLGIVELRVGWNAHRLEVSVAPERESYEVRSTATVDIEVRAADGSPLPPGAEVAIAAVDEGLLELAPNPTWKLIETMMEPRQYWVATATAQGQVIGKRHFGRKALPTGGGGGRQSTRELFDTLLFWEPRVRLDENGKARLQIPLNDSLTAFRIVAVANAGPDRFGTGAGTIRTTQELMVLSALPPVVREGDRFPAQFTVRNASDTTQSIDIAAAVEGLTPALAAKNLELAAGASQVVSWDVTVPRGIAALQYLVTANSATARDSLAAEQRVVPVHPVETFQATFARIAPELQVPVARPAGAEPDRGGVRVSLSPSLAAGLDGVQDYMRDYPYACLEQQVSQAVALRDRAAWERIVAGLATYRDKDGLLAFFPSMGRGSVELTTYVLAISHAAGFALPDDERDALTAALVRFLDGNLQAPRSAPTAGLALTKLSAIEALARYGAANPGMLESITIEPALWPTSSVLDLWSITHRLEALATAAVLNTDAERILRSRLRTQGTTLDFGAGGHAAAGFLTCPDGLMLRLTEMGVDAPTWRDEMPVLVRSAIQRQRRGRWDCTTSNAWGTVAVDRFAAEFEAEPVTGQTAVALGTQSTTLDWNSAAAPAREADLAWPADGETLRLTHSGSGAPWAIVQARAAVRLQAPLLAGYRLRKTIEPIEQRTPERFSRGDVWRVRLEIEASTDAAWVVVDDPLPPGATHLGTGLGRDRASGANDGAEAQPWWVAGPTYVERRYESFRAYYEWFPEGALTVSYTIRLNQDGRFALPATRVEALYSPEMFALLPNEPIEVAP